jgi:spermidine/putrescine transport system substrate-binding protein
LFKLWSVFLMLVSLSACNEPAPQPPSPVLAKELVLYNWADYMPQPMLDAFEKEYGVKVSQIIFDTAEEAAANISSGQVTFDIAVADNDDLPSLIAQGALAEIDFQNVPNIKNVSANFRDLMFDPDNRHSVPYNYGTTGLLVRSDLVKTPVKHWADLWNEQFTGKIALRAQPTELIGMTLRSLGYPLNSEDPSQLSAARDQLLALKERVRFVETDPEASLQPLLGGEVVIMLGWNGDARLARDRDPAIAYVIPEEGTMLWGDNFVISSKSPNKFTAETFLNFILRPEIGVEIVKATYYPTANDAATGLLPPDIANDPLVYPPRQVLMKNNFYQPLSPTGDKLYDQVWAQVMEAKP